MQSGASGIPPPAPRGIDHRCRRARQWILSCWFGWSPVVPSRYGNRFAYGHMWTNCDVVVSGGLGCSFLPFRLGVPPEIVLVTVGAKDSG